MHDVAPELLGERRVALFNPGSSPNQANRLRLVSPGTAVGCEFLFIPESWVIAWSCAEPHIGHDVAAMR